MKICKNKVKTRHRYQLTSGWWFEHLCFLDKTKYTSKTLFKVSLSVRTLFCKYLYASQSQKVSKFKNIKQNNLIENLFKIVCMLWNISILAIQKNPNASLMSNVSWKNTKIVQGLQDNVPSCNRYSV